MTFKGTAALFLMLLILGGWVYWTDVRGREEREQATEAVGLILPVDDEDIVEINIIYPDRTVSAVRTEGGWEFRSPEGYEADSGQWDIVAANVGRIDRDRSVTSEPVNLSPFGLAEPELRLGVRLADGSSEEILFGNENPRGTLDYLKLASSDEVFLAATSWAGLFSKDANDLRDKAILRFDQDQINAIEIAGERDLGLERDSEGWQIASPIETRANGPQASTLLGAIDFTRAAGFADPALSESDTGLDSPRWRIVLETEDAAVAHELLVGKQVSDNAGQYYARDASRRTVFIIDSEIVDLVSAPLLDWRDKTIVSFDRSGVTEIEIDKAATDAAEPERIELTRSENDWFTSGDVAVDFGQVSALLGALEFERATEIIDTPGALGNYGLDNPRLRVVFRDSAGMVVVDGIFGSDAGDADHVYWNSSVLEFQ